MIKHIPSESWQTSDGKEFADRDLATAHERRLYLEAILKPAQQADGSYAREPALHALLSSSCVHIFTQGKKP